MTRSYKMLVLLAMLNEDKLPGSIDVETLTRAVSRLAQRSAHFQADLGASLTDIDAQLETLVLDRAEVQVREPRRQQHRWIQTGQYPHEEWGQPGWRAGGRIERIRREVDTVIRHVPVHGGGHRCAVADHARVPHLVRRHRFLFQAGIPDSLNRKDEARECGRQCGEVHVCEDRGREVVVDERWRTKRAIE